MDGRNWLIDFLFVGDRMREGHPKTEHRATPAELNGDSRHHQMTSPGVNSSSSSGKAAEQQQHHPPPPRSHPGTPQPMAYRPTPPAVAYHVPNQVKVISCHPTSYVFRSRFKRFSLSFSISFSTNRMLQVRAYQVWNRWWTKFQTWPKESRINNNSISSSSNNTQTAYMVSNNPWPCRRVSVTTALPLPSLVSLILQRHSVTTRLTTLPPMEDPFHPTSTIQVTSNH